MTFAAEPADATPLDRDEREGLKFRHIATRGELDEMEQVNIASGLIWLARRRKRDILTESFIRELHRRLFGDVWTWAGQFRRSEKNIGIDPLQIDVELRMLLDDARYWADNDVFAPLEAGARFHHRLVRIHPFANGNGRHARMPPMSISAIVLATRRSNGRANAIFSAAMNAERFISRR
jgi:Fic-DOC domain mobile mystery protein B